MTRPYHGTPDQFNDELNVVTGIVNLKHGWDRIIKSEDPDLVARLGAWRNPLTPGAARSRPYQSMKKDSTARCGEAAHTLPGSRRSSAGPADATVRGCRPGVAKFSSAVH